MKPSGSIIDVMNLHVLTPKQIHVRIQLILHCILYYAIHVLYGASDNCVSVGYNAKQYVNTSDIFEFEAPT